MQYIKFYDKQNTLSLQMFNLRLIYMVKCCVSKYYRVFCPDCSFE